MLYSCENMLSPLLVRTARSGKAFYFLLVCIMLQTIYKKPFLSHQAPYGLLKSRGMLFHDEIKVLHLFKHISYYCFSGYWYPLLADKQNHIFKPNADLKQRKAMGNKGKECRMGN